MFGVSGKANAKYRWVLVTQHSLKPDFGTQPWLPAVLFVTNARVNAEYFELGSLSHAVRHMCIVQQLARVKQLQLRMHKVNPLEVCPLSYDLRVISKMKLSYAHSSPASYTTRTIAEHHQEDVPAQKSIEG